jgi:hypothetical protein
MFRTRVAVLAVIATGLFIPTSATATPHAGLGGPVTSVASGDDEPDPGQTKPANCGTANTPPCEA